MKYNTELVNNPIQVRQMLGLGAAGFDCGQFHLQTVIGNVALLSADLLEQVNRVLVAAGQAVAGHEPGTSLAGRCASFAVETDVHYPTDVNLLWDAVRCLIAVASAACAEVGLGGWRKRVALQLRLQALFNKVRRTRQAKPAAVRAYLAFCQRLVERAGGQLPDLQRAVEAERVAGLLGHARRQIDQVSRRLLKGERIPHAEKVFSVFEEHTRWVSKGKAGCPVELGVPVCIVEDQHQFVVGWESEWCGGDTDVAVPLVQACQQAYPELRSCSFDKGFHSPANRAALDGLLGLNALPRKGRLSGKDKEREGAEEFVQARQQHPAVESAINNLERRGLDRVRTHGKAGFERTVALAVTAARLPLPPGYYGVPSLLLLQSFMLLARVRNPEQLRYAQAGDWGALLGLDRCPEVKTLRAQVKALADDADTVRSWRDALTRDWLEQDPEAAATLCLDGHVQVYSGRQGRLKKPFVSRQKLCLPAAAGYWLNALDGQPFVCLHQDLDPGMLAAVRGEIVPHLRELGALPAVAEEGSEPAVTLVFDREGWSPKLFRELAREGVACVTWRKGKRGEDWPQNAFRELPVPVRGPGGERLRPVRLAKAPVDLLKDFQAREIRRLLDDGRQAAWVTTHPSLDTARVAGAMLSRWSQENYFKYMRHEFDLDALPEHALVPVEDDAEIVHPERRAIDKQVRRLRGRMAQEPSASRAGRRAGAATASRSPAATDPQPARHAAHARLSRRNRHARTGRLRPGPQARTRPRRAAGAVPRRRQPAARTRPRHARHRTLAARRPGPRPRRATASGRTQRPAYALSGHLSPPRLRVAILARSTSCSKYRRVTS